MIKTRLYLDTRSINRDGLAPLKLGICKRRETAYISLGIYLNPEHWDKASRWIMRVPYAKFPQRQQTELYINTRCNEVKSIIMRLECDGQLHKLTANEIRDKVQAIINPPDDRVLLTDMIRAYIDKMDNKRTRELYKITLGKVESYGKLTDMQVTTSADIEQFSAHLKDTGCTSTNGRNIHLRNIRAVYNYAMRLGMITNYPFRGVQIRAEETQKRSLTLEQLRRLASLPLTGYKAEYRDLFLLSFLLLGINFSDLCALTTDNMRDGRIYYKRRKTGKQYNIKVLPQAQALMERYAGQTHLINIAERYTDTHDYLKHINAGLRKLIPEPPYNALTTYWARHTWATLAYNECGASIDTISAGLGHEYGSKVTQVYINPDISAVDALNKKLADLIFTEFAL